MPVALNIILFSLFLIFGYVFGTLFYRRDPKEPDYRSFLVIAKNFTPNELKNWAVKVKKDKKVYRRDDEEVKKDTEEDTIITDPKEINSSTVDRTQVQFRCP